MHFKQLASRWEESETCLLPYRALNTICSFWSCCEGWLGHKAEGIWNFRVPGIKAFSLTPRLHDKKSCVKKPRASHPDFLTLFIQKLKGLACQTTLIVLYCIWHQKLHASKHMHIELFFCKCFFPHNSRSASEDICDCLSFEIIWGPAHLCAPFRFEIICRGPAHLCAPSPWLWPSKSTQIPHGR